MGRQFGNYGCGLLPPAILITVIAHLSLNRLIAQSLNRSFIAHSSLTGMQPPNNMSKSARRKDRRRRANAKREQKKKKDKKTPQALLHEKELELLKMQQILNQEKTGRDGYFKQRTTIKKRIRQIEHKIEQLRSENATPRRISSWNKKLAVKEDELRHVNTYINSLNPTVKNMERKVAAKHIQTNQLKESLFNHTTVCVE